MNERRLTPMQKRNLGAFQLKKKLLEDQFGNKVTIINTEDDILALDGPLAIPIKDLDRTGDKRLIMKCAMIYEDERTGERYLKYDADENPVAEDTEDVLDAIRRTIEVLEDRERRIIDKNALPRKKDKDDFAVPAGYKLVKIEEEDEAPAVAVESVEEAIKEVAPAVEDMGTIVKPKKKAKGKSKSDIKELLQSLLEVIAEDDEEDEE